MGFPGRLEEKKKFAVGFWFGVVLVVVLLFWGIWSIRQAIKKPAPAAQPDIEISDGTPGLVRKTVDQFHDNTKQIMDGKPLEKPAQRAYGSKRVNVSTARLIFQPRRQVYFPV